MRHSNIHSWKCLDVSKWDFQQNLINDALIWNQLIHLWKNIIENLTMLFLSWSKSPELMAISVFGIHVEIVSNILDWFSINNLLWSMSTLNFFHDILATFFFISMLEVKKVSDQKCQRSYLIYSQFSQGWVEIAISTNPSNVKFGS